MDEAIRKAKVLIEALSWIQRFRGRYVVVKIGGSTLDDLAAVDSLLTDVVFMATVGMKPVIVHGGGKAISAAMSAALDRPFLYTSMCRLNTSCIRDLSRRCALSAMWSA